MKKLFRSLFVKLLVVFMITVGAISVVIYGTIEFSRSEDAFRPILDNFSRYAEYLADDIGSPPNLTRAQQIADSVRVNIAIFHGDIAWKTDEEMQIPERSRHALRQATAARVDHSYIVYFNRGPFTYVFEIPGDRQLQWETTHLAMAFLLILIILVLSYQAVARIMRPLRWIREGALRMGKGELDYRLPAMRDDELGELSVEINEMASRLEKLLESKRQLLLAISHEIRTPLTRATVSSEFVEDEKVRQSLLVDLKEMTRLTEEILEAENIGSKHFQLNLEVARASELIQQVIDERFSKKRDLIRLNLKDSTQDWTCDITRMKLVIKNLIENALMHSAEKGEQVEVELMESEAKVRLKVTDRGQGVAAEHLPHLTEAFYRTDASRRRHTGGYGLGLYLCRLVIEAHGGSIQIESQIGEGTQVLIQVPRHTRS